MEDKKRRFRGFRRYSTIKFFNRRNFVESILEKKKEGKNAIIGEIKFASPLGDIREYEDVANLAVKMVRGGVCGISVITEEKYFKGDIEYLVKVKEASSVPVLRKDFIFDVEQIYESHYYGADAVLIIASLLDEEEIKKLINACRTFNIEPFVEVHSKKDIEIAKNSGARVFVINNRDKDTLEVDIERTKELSKYIKSGIKISASGINRDNIKDIRKYADAFLIGTSIMKADDVEKEVEALVNMI